MATTSDMKSETRNEIPRGLSIRPSIPDRKNSGKNATIIIRVAIKIDALISFEASKTIVNEDSLSSAGFFLFCRSLLYTFSTSIMASSTSEPIAIAIPPRLMVLIVIPRNLRTRTAPRSDKGMASSEMTVVLKLPRKTSRMIVTNTAPSISARWTFLTDLSIKSACRNIFVSSLTSGGRPDFRPSRFFSI